MENRFQPCSLNAVLETQATVLTVNQRLSRSLIDELGQMQLGAGHQSWVSVDCLPYQSWLLRCWSNRLEQGALISQTHERLLNANQNQWVWRQIISEHPVGPLLNLNATAKAVAKAWEVFNAWCLTWPQSINEDSPDVAAFVRWKKAFLTRSSAEKWLDSARLPNVLSSWFESVALAVPPRLVLAGFDHITPQQDQLFKVLQDAGCQIGRLELENNPAKVFKASFEDETEELNQAAQWARCQVEADANARVAVIIPDLQQRRDAVERSFRRTCYPGALRKEQLPDVLAFNLSYGRPLDQYPLVDCALTALHCLTRAPDLETISRLLRSRFLIAGDQEWTQRARLQNQLCRQGLLQLSWGQLASQIRLQQRDQKHFCHHLLAAIEAVQQASDTWSPRLLPAEWANHFSAALTLLGWPGDQSLDSTEYQTRQRWFELLQAFSALGEVSGRLRLHEALSELSLSARQCVFQPKTEVAPIQVMGVLESAGHSFDALWVMGVSHQNWPLSATPNPYLPFLIQQKAGVPEASPEAQLLMAERHINQWANTADTVLFSWPEQNESGALQASALLAPFSQWPTSNSGEARPKSYEDVLFEVGALERLQDEQGSVIEHGAEVRGGVGIIRDQSACPFRAYANHRLHAEPVEEPAPGLDARSRGSLVHQCLEALWEQLKTQQALRALSESECERLVAATVQDKLEAAIPFNPQLRGAFLSIERQRLCQMLLDWLGVEGQREPFQVEHLEQRKTLEIEGLSIHTVVDRVDRLENDALAIIDYKTGLCQVSDWFGERPKDPQLPLYGCMQEETVSALAFAQLKAGKYEYKGVCDEDQPFSPLKPLSKLRKAEKASDWASQMQSWSADIHQLAKSFAMGEAQVDPGPGACRYCELDPFCRVQSINANVEDDAG